MTRTCKRESYQTGFFWLILTILSLMLKHKGPTTMDGWDINACQENNSLQNSSLIVAALVAFVWVISEVFLSHATSQASQNSVSDALKICNTLWFLYKIVASSTGSGSIFQGVGTDFCTPVNCDSPNSFALIIFLVHKAQCVHPSAGGAFFEWEEEESWNHQWLTWQLQQSLNPPVKAYVWYGWLQGEFFQGFCLEASFHQTITKTPQQLTRITNNP